MVAPENGESRYEIKLEVGRAGLAEVQMWLRLHPAGFLVTYPQRQVNNIYFDTPDLASVEVNLAGMSERSKLRLRWYGRARDIMQGTWELKRKRAGLAWKERLRVDQTISFTSMRWREVLALLLAGASGIIGVHLGGTPWPTLINHYQRKYYASWDGTIRATIDYDQTFYDQRFSVWPNLNRPLPSPDDITLEFKASPADYDRLVDVVQRLPVRVARTSKYVNGMLYAAAPPFESALRSSSLRHRRI